MENGLPKVRVFVVSMIYEQPQRRGIVQGNWIGSVRRFTRAIETARSVTNRDFVEVGGLMSYGTDVSNMFQQVGAYTGQILHGAKPAVPVVQSTRFEFAVNALTARALGIEVSPGLLASADAVIK
jgi:hypothetical protein